MSMREPTAMQPRNMNNTERSNLGMQMLLCAVVLCIAVPIVAGFVWPAMLPESVSSGVMLLGVLLYGSMMQCRKENDILNLTTGKRMVHYASLLCLAVPVGSVVWPRVMTRHVSEGVMLVGVILHFLLHHDRINRIRG